jgi:hypothetical protein
MIKLPEPIEYTHTRIKKSSLAKAKKIVAKKSKYASVAHMLEVLIDEEAKK